MPDTSGEEIRVFVDPPTALVIVGGDDAVTDVLAGLRRRYPADAIVDVTGGSGRTQVEFFTTMRDALEIPYDSVGWDVLNEALHDLTWLPGDHRLIVIHDANALLADAPGGRQIAAEILAGWLRDDAGESGGERPRRGLLLTASSDGGATLTGWLEEVGLPFRVLEETTGPPATPVQSGPPDTTGECSTDRP